MRSSGGTILLASSKSIAGLSTSLTKEGLVALSSFPFVDSERLTDFERKKASGLCSFTLEKNDLEPLLYVNPLAESVKRAQITRGLIHDNIASNAKERKKILRDCVGCRELNKNNLPPD